MQKYGDAFSKSSSIYGELTLCLLGSTFFCHLLITFVCSFDPKEDLQNVGPDLAPRLDTLIVFLKDFC